HRQNQTIQFIFMLFFTSKFTSIVLLLSNVGRKIHINVNDYSTKTSIVLIDHLFLESNRGLVDSTFV
ncbi:hypothetical protein BpHYR1_021490, partial [Brachionus plicatilis]